MKRAIKVVKLSLWMGVWAGWAWLGAGLYRELPRKFGAPVCTLPLDKRAVIAGFVGDTNRVAVIAAQERSFRTNVQVFDAETGEKVGEVYGPSLDDFLTKRLDPVRNERLFARALPDADGANWKKGLYVLDVTKLQWRRVSEHQTYAAVHHRARPWLLFMVSTPSRSSLSTPIVAFDYETEREVFRRDLEIWNTLEPGPFFSAGDQVVIPFRGPFADPQGGALSLEVWTTDDPPRQERTVADIPFLAGHDLCAAAGRVAFMDRNQRPSCVKVLDVNNGTVVFCGPPLDRITVAALRGFGMTSPAVSPRVVSPLVSASGRCVFGGYPATLWEIDSERVLWRAGPHEMAWSADSDEQFQVVEKWSNLWKPWLPNTREFITYAFRSLETGELVYRTSDRMALRPANRNGAGTLGVADDGKVYRLPLRASWLLVVFSQLVLATPLVMVWGVVRWRRLRKRRAAVAATPVVAG